MHTMLTARSDFSIGESILKIETLVEAAKAAGESVIGLTDTMSVTGMIDLTNRAKKAGIKPIVGCRLRLVDDPTWRKPKGTKDKAPPDYYLTYYALSEKGVRSLFGLLTLANSPDRFYNNAKLGFSDLFDALDTLSSEDVAIATGDVYSAILHADAVEILQKIVARLSASNVFLTLVPIDTPYWDSFNKRVITIGETLPKFGITANPMVARPAFYKVGDDAAHEIMDTISKNQKIIDPWHNTLYNRDFHPLSARELVEECKKTAARLIKRGVTHAGSIFRSALAGNQKLADLAKFEWSKAPVSLPAMAPNEFAAVMEECKKGWTRRFGAAVFGHKPDATELATYRERLAYELSILKKLNFSGYFLLVQDVVQFAKKNGILVGPGRGSVGGSLVAYLMGITDCDPIRFGLLFERFINPDRIDLPDADLDFMSARREEVIQYLIDKYGAKRVAGVSNFGTLGPASAIRDVCRVLGMDERDYACTKLMPKKHGAHIPLEESAGLVAEIGEFRDTHPDIWKISRTLEGVMRNLGQHAAGIVVGGCDIVERAVIERRKEGAVVCWDKRIVEDQGLVKMDILGLQTLDLIAATLNYIRRRHSARVDLMKIPLDDEKVLANFAKGVTTGIFQFESGGMRRLLRELGADGAITFDDITAATALYRPGPMESGMMDSYWKRKQGLEPIEYDHALMKPILEPTNGVIVYQEQVMQVARAIAGYSAPDADKLRKIMGKKLPEEMKKERGKFVDGCVKTIGETEEWAGNLFDMIEGFAGYGFNKSHSVEYALISYQSMWLKTNYPVEFFAAALSLMDSDKLPALLKDAERFGIEVVLPDVNLSTDQFEILTDTKLCVPFNRVKGLSERTAQMIAEKRGAVPFKDKADFVARVDRRLCNVSKVAALEKVGAFARIEPGSLPANHPDRIRDQVELIPGLVHSVVPVHRDLATDRATKIEIARLVQEYRIAHGPSGDEEDGMPVSPTLGSAAKFMVISDAPSNGEEREGRMAFGNSFEYVSEALHECDLSRSDGYWTALIKRPKAGKQVSPEEIRAYVPYLEKEIELLKPPTIVLLGSQTVRHFFPDFKGKASEAAGKVVYLAKYDANVVIGFNPSEIFFDPDKQALLNEVFSMVASIHGD